MHFFGQTYLLLFVASSPIAYVAMFVAMTPHLNTQERWDLSRQACHVSLCILLFVALLGEIVLNLLGVSLGAFRIAGGIVMALMGWDMLKDDLKQPHKRLSKEHVVVPIAFPMISGPGAISALMMARSSVVTLHDKLGLYSAVFCLMLTFYALFYVASFTSKFLKEEIILFIYRLSGIIILLIAVEFIAKGLQQI